MASPESIGLWVLGFVGLSGTVSAVHSSRRLSQHHRFFRFQRKEPADFVLTTSAHTKGGYGIKYVRSVTAVGNLKGSAEIAASIGYGSPRRRINLSVSAELESSLSGDLVIIGLPGKNEASRLVIEYLNALYPDVRLAITEAAEGPCGLALGEFRELDYKVERQGRKSIYPKRDLALIVLWVNPLTVKKRRLVLCAGFTAYGTAAAANYLVDELVNDRIKRLRDDYPKLPKLWRRKWLCFAMLIEVKLINDQVVDVIERAFAPLEDPGSPPFQLAKPEEAPLAGD
jgi:hypothetical protein